MQETSNYKLNQWESTDRILMDNFNEDNRAIDKELAAQEKRIAAVESGKASSEDVAAAQTLVKIGEVTLSSASTSLSYTLENAENWRSIVVYFDLLAGSYQTLFGVNSCDSKNRVELYSVGSSNSVKKAIGKAEIVPSANGGASVHVVSTAYYSSYYTDTNDSGNFADTFNGTVTFKIYNDYSKNHSAGSKMTIYGIKK